MSTALIRRIAKRAGVSFAVASACWSGRGGDYKKALVCAKSLKTNPVKRKRKVSVKRNAKRPATETQKRHIPISRRAKKALRGGSVAKGSYYIKRTIARGKKHYSARLPNKGKKTRRNPLDSAVQTYVDFHGRQPDKTVVVTEKIHEHKYLSGIGDLEALTVIAPDERAEVGIRFGKGVILAQNEKKPASGKTRKPQLFIRGGDQSVKLSDFGIKDPVHESEVLGVIKQIDYFTRKDHLRPEDGGTATYQHKFGPRSIKIHKKPTLIYDTVNRLLSIAGGSYTIPDEGIDN